MQYRAHHSNPVNRGIHLVSTPLILFSALCIVSLVPQTPAAEIPPRAPSDYPPQLTDMAPRPKASHSGTLVPAPSWMTLPCLDLNLGTIAAILWSSLYILLEPVAGSALAIICLAAAALGNHLRLASTDNCTLFAALALNLVCWIAQLVGHAFQGNATSLLDSLVQPIFLAPLFVWFELLFKLGYRPELQSRVNAEVKKRLTQFHASSAKKNGKAL